MKKHSLSVLEEMDDKELIELLCDLIKIPSPTEDEREVAQHIAKYAKANNFTNVNISNKWDVVARIDGEMEGPRILFLTHTDHSKPKDAENAFSPKELDGHDFGKTGPVIRGKGSCAPKGTLAAMLYAGKILAQRKRELKGSLIIAAVSRDLIANHDGVREVARLGWIDDANMAIVGEPSNNQPVIGARGINHIAIRIPGKPTHWGNPKGGKNPVWNLEQVLSGIRGLIANLPSHPVLGGATLAPIDVKCEMSPPQTPNLCRLLLDRRSLPGEDADAVVQGIKEALEKTAIEEKIEIELVKQMFPFEGDPESFISKQVSAVNEAITGKISPFGYLTFASNGGYLTGKMKIPSVVYGPGRITDLIPVEHIEISSVVTAAKVYAGTVIEVFCR